MYKYNLFLLILFFTIFINQAFSESYNKGEAPFAINGVDVPITKDGKLYEPQIKGKWKTLFFPKNATYMNDHSIYLDNDGKWHIIGIGNDIPFKKFPSPWRKEIQFVHWSG